MSAPAPSSLVVSLPGARCERHDVRMVMCSACMQAERPYQCRCQRGCIYIVRETRRQIMGSESHLSHLSQSYLPHLCHLPDIVPEILFGARAHNCWYLPCLPGRQSGPNVHVMSIAGLGLGVAQAKQCSMFVLKCVQDTRMVFKQCVQVLSIYQVTGSSHICR